MTKTLMIAAIVAAIAVSACRREEPEEEDSMKLGAPISTSQIAR